MDTGIFSYSSHHNVSATLLLLNRLSWCPFYTVKNTVFVGGLNSLSAF